MELLLDTCTALWLELAPDRVPSSLTRLLADRDNPVFLSAATVWEIAVKWSSGHLDLPMPPSDFIKKVRLGSDIEALPVDEAAALQVAKLPKLHGDPFDRMLIAQSIEYGLVLATPDHKIRQYAVRTIWD